MTAPDDHNDLRAVFADAFRQAQATDACPSPDQLYDAFHRLLPLDERLEIVDHLASCPMCADAWRLAARTDPPPQVRRSPPDPGPEE